MTIDQWLSHVLKLQESGIKPGLERMNAYLDRYQGSPSCPVIAVGGTNGKGSCVEALVSIYSKAGFRVGSFISPHLLKVNERFRINTECVDDDLILEHFERINALGRDLGLSYFELLCVTAWQIFCEASLDVMIFEVGLGGKLDAVNALPLSHSIITSIDLDHQEYLGNDRDSIAIEKFGILRENKAAVIAETDLTDCMIKALDQTGAMKYVINQSFKVVSNQKSHQYLGDTALSFTQCTIHPQVLGAVCKTLELTQSLLPVPNDLIQKTLCELQVPGRFERVQGEPPMIIDVAHNEAAIKNLLKQWPYPSSNTTMMVAFKKNKTIKEVLSNLNQYAQNIIFVEMDDNAFVSKQVFIANLASCVHYELISFDEVKERVWTMAQPTLVFGCFKLVGHVRSLFKERGHVIKCS